MTVAAALADLAAGSPRAALRTLSTVDTPLARALERHLTAVHDGRVYDDPAAFQAFIGGGGNVELYRATSALLADAQRGLSRVLDLGCGDGRAVLPAATALLPDAPTLDLVEPSAALLSAAVAGAATAGLAATAHQGTVQDFLRTACGHWDLVESTFALHAVPTPERTDVLAGLRRVAGRILLVEFDVPAFTDGGLDHLAHLADRYERGIAEYPEGPVVPGFLMPVLVGQVRPGGVRNTWEQPAAAWAAQLTRAGWHDVTVTALAPYWWATAIALTASAHPHR
jgi:SAM-dependent methyltransferase